jgi:hypothetical protein
MDRAEDILRRLEKALIAKPEFLNAAHAYLCQIKSLTREPSAHILKHRARNQVTPEVLERVFEQSLAGQRKVVERFVEETLQEQATNEAAPLARQSAGHSVWKANERRRLEGQEGDTDDVPRSVS